MARKFEMGGCVGWPAVSVEQVHGFSHQRVCPVDSSCAAILITLTGHAGSPLYR
ncbi:MAG: hypothetical protein V4491_09590 [Pseudomonadota bacterium]